MAKGSGSNMSGGSRIPPREQLAARDQARHDWGKQNEAVDGARDRWNRALASEGRARVELRGHGNSGDRVIFVKALREAESETRTARDALEKLKAARAKTSKVAWG